MKRFVVFGALLVALTLAGLAVHVPGEGNVGSTEREFVLVAILAAQVVVWLMAVAPGSRRIAVPLWLVLGFAVAIRAPLLVSPPFLSSDINRYVWDGRVQAAGINPYLYIPADPALAALQDHPVFNHINRREYAPTIYPPAAQIIFAAVGQVWQSVYAIKATMLAFEALAVFCLLRLLDIAQLPRSRVLIYAWNPLAAWAFTGNGHIDAAAAGLLALALLLRVARRDSWAGAVFGAAVLTKFLPLVVAPALWRPRGGWRLVAAGVTCVVALYAIYASAGQLVFGFLGGYGAEEGLGDGSGIWLLAGLRHLTPLPRLVGPLYLGIVGAGLAILGWRIAFRPHPPAGSAADAIAVCRDIAILMTCLTLALSPRYAWYYPWLALPAVLAPYPVVLWLSVAPVLLYIDPFNDRFLWPSLVYVPALCLAAIALRRRSMASPAVAIEGKS